MNEIYKTQGFDDGGMLTRSEHVQALSLQSGNILFVTGSGDCVGIATRHHRLDLEAFSTPVIPAIPTSTTYDDSYISGCFK